MNRLLSLWLAGVLLLPSCCGSPEEEEEYDYVTPTPEYDYNQTFEYEYYRGSEEEEEKRFETPPSDDEYDENHTIDYEFFNNSTADYSLYEIVNARFPDHPTDKAAGIGQLTPMLLLGLAAHQMLH